MSLEDYQSFFKNKRITLMGLGLLGRGAGDVEFLAKCGAILTVTDLKSEKELRSSLARLKKYRNIRYVLGGHKLEDFRGADLVIKSAGVPLDSPYIAEARKCGVPVAMSTALFARFSPATLVGVTGTRGKSTITHLIYEMLKASGKKVHLGLNRHTLAVGRKTRESRVFLGGNVKGVSTLALLPKVKAEDIVVLELDSWQLQGLGEEKISPHIAIFSNLLSDHLNYYKDNPEQYFIDKAQICFHQKKGDYLVVGRQVATLVRRSMGDRKEKPKLILPKVLPVSWKLKIPGAHNRENAALAAEAARLLGISAKVIRWTLESFAGVPGRLEFVREVRGVKVYNDTTATTPEATLAALKTLGANRKLTLIMGGADKNLPMDKLLKALPRYCKKVVLLPGSGTEKLRLSASAEKISLRVSNLPGAVREGLEAAGRGGTLLFSPAFASFGLFRNEFDRGERFVKIISKLK